MTRDLHDQTNEVDTKGESWDGDVSGNGSERWLQEKQAALVSSNAYVERHGIPLTEYRRF